MKDSGIDGAIFRSVFARHQWIKAFTNLTTNINKKEKRRNVIFQIIHKIKYQWKDQEIIIDSYGIR